MIKSINVTELKAKLDDPSSNVIVIDCREQNEWDQGHLEKAILIPLSQFQELYKSQLKDKDAQIIMQCRSGKRSMQACHYLSELGFSDVTNLEGGIMHWSANNYKIVTD